MTLDEDFGRDLEKIINSHREPLDPPAWDSAWTPASSSQQNAAGDNVARMLKQIVAATGG